MGAAFPALSRRLHLSAIRQLYSISFFEPYFLDSRFTAGIDLYDQQRYYNDFAQSSIGGGLTLGLRGGGVLLSVLVLPLYVPVLVLGAGAADMAAAGLDVSGHFMLLGALLIAAAVLAPWAIAAALRVACE